MNITDYFKPKPHRAIDALVRDLLRKKSLTKSMEHKYVVETDKLADRVTERAKKQIRED